MSLQEIQALSSSFSAKPCSSTSCIRRSITHHRRSAHHDRAHHHWHRCPGGHVLLEGVPVCPRPPPSRACRTLALSFARLQFTPDLLPADLIGTTIYNQQRGDFTVKKGPIFANIRPGFDEINTRAQPGCSPALLEERLQSTASPSATPPSSCPSRSWCWRRKTRSSKRAPIVARKRSSTASCSRWWSPTRPWPRSAKFSAMTGVERQAITDKVIRPEDIVNARLVVKQIVTWTRRGQGTHSQYRARHSRPRAFPHQGPRAVHIEYMALRRAATLALTMAAKSHAFLRHRGFVNAEKM